MYFSHIVFLSVRFRILEKIDLEIWYIRLRLNFNQQRWTSREREAWCGDRYGLVLFIFFLYYITGLSV